MRGGLLPGLLAALTLVLPPAGWAAGDGPPLRGGWKGAVHQASRLADELSAYPVRHDVFHRCVKTLDVAREALEEAGGADPASPPAGLAERMRRAAEELKLEQRQVRDVVLEFGKGLELSYEGAFSDFGGRAEELAVLLGRVRDALGAAESRFRAGAAAS